MFKRSSFCDTGTCVEVELEVGHVVIRHSDIPSSRIIFTREEWTAFIRGVHNGEFESPVAE